MTYLEAVVRLLTASEAMRPRRHGNLTKAEALKLVREARKALVDVEAIVINSPPEGPKP